MSPWPKLNLHLFPRPRLLPLRHMATTAEVFQKKGPYTQFCTSTCTVIMYMYIKSKGSFEGSTTRHCIRYLMLCCHSHQQFIIDCNIHPSCFFMHTYTELTCSQTETITCMIAGWSNTTDLVCSERSHRRSKTVGGSGSRLEYLR